MPQLTHIQGILIQPVIGAVTRTHMSTELGVGDYISISGFVASLQNFSQVSEVIDMITPLKFGLNNMTQSTTLEITY